jgi:isoquinoline 1-oxidoreductase beta subunit
VQAAQIAQAAGVPVKLIWSREEDIRQDNYRPAILSRFKAGLDTDGRPLAWVNQYVDKHEPADAPHIPYAIAHQNIHYVDSPTHVRFGPWRSVDHSQHGFFTESFVDELANAAGKDPFEFRRDLLAEAPRHRKVLETAAEKAGWGEPLPEGWGRGISLQKSFGSIVAQVVDVEVKEGQVRVHRVVCAVDPGFAVSPDGLVAQMESGIVYGLTAALYGEVSIEAGAAKQGNFNDYPMVRMTDAPVIETHIVESGESLGGAGEPGTPGVAPALANAIYAATGTRIRELPVRKYDLRFKIEEREEVG